MPVPIAEKPDVFLQNLKIADKFALLTGLAGEVRIKASSVVWLLSKYPGVTDPRVKCVLSSAGGFFQILEDVPTARARLDAVRAKEDAVA
jgi:hypothetical protein